MKSNTKLVVVAKMRPVAMANNAPARNKDRRVNLEAVVPVSNVNSAEPNNIPVTTTPIRVPE
jgi:hypothetical protein